MPTWVWILLAMAAAVIALYGIFVWGGYRTLRETVSIDAKSLPPKSDTRK